MLGENGSVKFCNVLDESERWRWMRSKGVSYWYSLNSSIVCCNTSFSKITLLDKTIL